MPVSNLLVKIHWVTQRIRDRVKTKQAIWPEPIRTHRNQAMTLSNTWHLMRLQAQARRNPNLRNNALRNLILCLANTYDLRYAISLLKNDLLMWAAERKRWRNSG